MRPWSFCLAALAILAACDSPIITDRCFILVAQVTPDNPRLQVGDTVTMHATFFPEARACFPPDTTAAGLRWISGDSAIIAVDARLGRLTAVRPGVTQIMVVPAGSGGVLGTTFASVREPPTADSLISLVQNNTLDSAIVVLEDANGAVVRSVTLAAATSTCWNTDVRQRTLQRVAVSPRPAECNAHRSEMGRTLRPRCIAHVAGCHRPAGLGHAHVGPCGVEPRSGLLAHPPPVDEIGALHDISIIVDMSSCGRRIGGMGP